ncbi:hypothetical protein ACH5RR_020994 [Cinchona calisaya]|uniref:Homeobox domain-containing protein n=1 Tax=Cinchona calisaya TaxID=153742 RepID=A0ABD2ZG13_9GENT
METSNFRPELHVAQKSRRDKLRVQHHSNPSTAQYGDVYTDQLDQFSSHDEGLSPDLVQLRSFRYGNLSYEPTVFSSEMLNFASNSKDVTMVNQDSKRIEGDEEPPVTNLSHTLAANINSSAKVSCVPQNCSTWKSIGSQESCDWIANYTSGSAGGIESNNPNPIFVGGGLSGSSKSNNNNPSTSTLYSNKPSSSYCYHHEVRSSLTSPPSKISSLNSPKHYGDRVHFKSVPSLYHSANTCQEVSSATVMTQDLGVATIAKQNNRQTAHVSWSNAGNELVLLPAYADHSNPFRLKNGYDECHGWNGELDYSEKNALDRDHRTIANDSANTQALSLSLSSVPLSKSLVCQTGERIMSEDSRSGAGCFSNIQEIKALKSDYLCFDSKQSYDGKVLENVHDDMVVNPTFAHRGACPLGPFTGYATILKSSRFLKPAQQLLGEFCNLVGPKCIKMLEPPEKISDEIRASGDAVNINESIAAATVGDSGGSSSTFYSSNEKTLDPGGLNGPSESYRPEYLQKKAKLIYMLEEVCRRYKQYHQQMQMVVSSFECVAGLSAATPYISQALKTVSRHFRCLRNAISDQLKNVRKALGEDLSFNNTGTSSSKGDTSTSRLKLMDQNFQKQKVGGNVGLFEPQQHVWRPQRGLPERAVAILRAWLFDHFLHPYPTDSDKHMLATQTGLSRNQVSNWFINARVRVWKPMVEEIHTLETKGMAETGTNEGKTEGKKTSENVSRSNDSQPLNRLNTGKSTEKQVECSEIGSSAIMGDRMNDADAWNQKRTQVDCHIPESMDGSLAGCVPYQQSGIGIGGLGAVSLTLGLRQNADGVQPQYPLQQQHEYQLRRHFGDQIIYDFVG